MNGRLSRRRRVARRWHGALLLASGLLAITAQAQPNPYQAWRERLGAAPAAQAAEKPAPRTAALPQAAAPAAGGAGAGAGPGPGAAPGPATGAGLGPAVLTLPAAGAEVGGFAGMPERCPGALPAGPLALGDALIFALCRHPAARQSWAAVQAASAERAWWAAPRRPTVQAVAEAGVGRSSSRTPGESPLRARGAVGSIELEVDWVLFDFGLRDAQGRSALAALQAAQASHEESLHAVMLETVQAYYALTEAEAVLALVRETDRYMRELLSISLRPKNPRQEALDSLGERQARTSLSERALDLRRAQAEASRARGQLALLLGLPVHTPLTLPPLPDAALDPDFEPGLSQLMDEAMARHPALQAARAQVGQARADLEAARLADRPVLRAGARLRRDRDAAAFVEGERQAGLTLEIPLFAGADRARQVRQAEASVARAEAEAVQAQRDRSGAVWVQYQTVREELAAVRLAQRWREEAEALLAAETQAFIRQDSDMFDVLDAHDSVLRARTALAAAISALAQSRFRLGSALGRLPLATAIRP